MSKMRDSYSYCLYAMYGKRSHTKHLPGESDDISVRKVFTGCHCRLRGERWWWYGCKKRFGVYMDVDEGSTVETL